MWLKRLKIAVLYLFWKEKRGENKREEGKVGRRKERGKKGERERRRWGREWKPKIRGKCYQINRCTPSEEYCAGVVECMCNLKLGAKSDSHEKQPRTQSGDVSWPGIKQATFWWTEWCATNWPTLARVNLIILILLVFLTPETFFDCS